MARSELIVSVEQTPDFNQMKTETVLCLSSLESTRFESVRECRLVRRMSFDTGKQFALMNGVSPWI